MFAFSQTLLVLGGSKPTFPIILHQKNKGEDELSFKNCK